jgi:ring-1,2-phenylacetyl-CoA epoxidase subunit PaaB
MDTQWPRYEVFVQEREGQAYTDAGSVHAPDAELALLNARDVFARRPEAVSMWVIPAEAIFSRTDEELRTHGLELPEPAGERQPYCVFCKAKAAGTQTLLGSVEAASPQEALATGLAVFGEQFSPLRPPFAWWVAPQRAVTASDPADLDSFYAPALDKPFRLSTDFKTHTAMRQLKTEETPRG